MKIRLNSNLTKIKESILRTLLDERCISPFTDIDVVSKKTPSGRNTLVTVTRNGSTPRGTGKWLYRSQFRLMKDIDNSDGKTHPAFDDLHKNKLIDAETDKGEKKHQITVEGIGFLKALEKI